MRQPLDSSLRDFFLRGGIPVTKSLMVCAVITMLINVFGGMRILDILVFSIPGESASWQIANVLFKPWTLITYPLISPASPLGVMFSIIWLWFVGSSLERRWGSIAFAGFFGWSSILTAIGALLAALLSGKPTAMFGLWIPLAPLTIAWAALNPEAQVMFYFILPLKAKYLGWITAAFLYLYEGVRIHPIYGLLILLGCAAAFYQMSPRTARPASVGDITLYPKAAKKGIKEQIADWRRKQKLKKLFKNSGIDDKDFR